MSDLLSTRVNSMKESATIEMSRLARELKAKGVPIISLSLGEPDFSTPEFILEGAKTGMEEGYTHYPPIPGYLDLRESISRKLKRENGVDFPPQNIVVSTGAKQSIANIMLCLLNPGDKVVIFTPYWVSYLDIVQMAGGKGVLVEGKFDQAYKVNPAELENKMDKEVKAVIFSSPSNPTGSLYSKEELKEFARVLSKYPNCLIISDEIYEYIVYEGEHQSISQFPEVSENVVIINGLSKGFAMTGWRVGYMAGPGWLATACTKMQGQLTSATCSIAQRAALVALEGPRDEVVKMKNEFRERRDLVFEGLSKIEGISTYLPKGAFYMLPNIRDIKGRRSPDGMTIKDSTDFCMYLLKSANVSTVTGSAFGAPDTFRISFAASREQLEEAIRRIEKAVNELE
jgi:aspartate aminotransferase